MSVDRIIHKSNQSEELENQRNDDHEADNGESDC